MKKINKLNKLKNRKNFNNDWNYLRKISYLITDLKFMDKALIDYYEKEFEKLELYDDPFYFSIICHRFKNLNSFRRSLNYKPIMVIDLNDNHDEDLTVQVRKRKNVNKRKNTHENKNVKNIPTKEINWEKILKKTVRTYVEKEVVKKRDLLRKVNRDLKETYDLPQKFFDNKLVLEAQMESMSKIKAISHSKKHKGVKPKNRRVIGASNYKKSMRKKLETFELEPQMKIFSSLYSYMMSFPEEAKHRENVKASFVDYFRDYLAGMDPEKFADDTEKFQYIETIFNTTFVNLHHDSILYRFDRQFKTYGDLTTMVEKALTYTDNVIYKNIALTVGLYTSTNFINSLSLIIMSFSKYDPCRRQMARLIINLVATGIISKAAFYAFSYMFPAEETLKLDEEINKANEINVDEPLEMQGPKEDFKKFSHYKSVLDFMNDFTNRGSTIYLLFKKLFILLVLSPLGEKFSLSGKAFQDLLDKFLGGIEDKTGFIDTVLSFGKMLFNISKKCYDTQSIAPLFAYNTIYQWYEDVKNYKDEALAIGMANGTIEGSLGSDYLERGKILHRDGIVFIRDIDPKKDPGEYYTANHVLKVLFDHLDAISIEFGVGRMRPQAFAMGIISTPGIGKSSFRNDAEIIIGAVNGVRFQERLAAPITAGDKYNAAIKQWSKFIRADDIDKAIDKNDISPWMNIGRMMDNCALPLNTADVPTKGKLVPTPICVTITSNAPNFGITGLTDYAYFFRRIDHIVKLLPRELPSECFIDPLAKREELRFDWNGIRKLDIKDDELYEIQIYTLNKHLDLRFASDPTADYMGPQPSALFTSIKEYHAYLKVRAENWAGTQTSYIEKMATKNICDKCNFLDTVCICVEPQVKIDRSYVMLGIGLLTSFGYIYVRIHKHALKRKFIGLLNDIKEPLINYGSSIISDIALRTLRDEYLKNALKGYVTSSLKEIVDIKYMELNDKYNIIKENIKLYAPYIGAIGLSIYVGLKIKNLITEKLTSWEEAEKLRRAEQSRKDKEAHEANAQVLVGLPQQKPVGRNHVFTGHNTGILPDKLNYDIYPIEKFGSFDNFIKSNLYTMKMYCEDRVSTIEIVHLGMGIFLSNAHCFEYDASQVRHSKDFNPKSYDYVDSILISISQSDDQSPLNTVVQYTLELNYTYFPHESHDYAILYCPGIAPKKGLYAYLSSSIPVGDAAMCKFYNDHGVRQKEIVNKFQLHVKAYNRFDESNPIFQYHADKDTTAGDCGAPLFSFRNSNYELFGIHCAGITTLGRNLKFCVRIDKHEIDGLLDKLYNINTSVPSVQSRTYYLIDGGMEDVQIEICDYIHPKCPLLNHRESTEMIPIGNIERIKKPNEDWKKFQTSTNFRSRTIVNPLGNFVAPELLLLRKDNPLAIPYVTHKTQEGSYSHPDLAFIKNIGDKGNVSSRLVFELLKDFYKEAPNLEGIGFLTPQSIDEALTGVSENLLSNKMKLSSSTGFPRGGKKSKYIEIDNKKVLKNELEGDVKMILALLGEGFVIIPFGTRSLKDEAMSEAKLKERGPRVFVCMPAAYNIVCKMYLDPFMTLFTQHRDYFRVLFGMNLPSIEVHDYLRMMKAFDANYMFFDGDISHMDSNVMKSIKEAINMFVEWLATFTSYNIIDRKILKNLLLTWIHMMISFQGDVFLTACNLVSGGWFTAFFGTLYCICLFLFVHHKHKQKYCLQYSVREKSPSGFCGDDNLIGCHYDLSRTFTFEFYQKTLESIGIKYTPPDKKSLTHVAGSFWKAEILKRRVKFNEYLDDYVAILDPLSMSKMMSYLTRTDVDIEIQLSGICTSLLMEAFLHDVEVFRVLRWRIYNYITTYNRKIKLPNIVLDEYKLYDRYKGNNFSVWDAFEAERVKLDELEEKLKSSIINGIDNPSTGDGMQHRDFAKGRIVLDKGRLRVQYNVNDLELQVKVNRSSYSCMTIKTIKMYKLVTEKMNNIENMVSSNLEVKPDIEMIETAASDTMLNAFDDLGETLVEQDVVDLPMSIRDPWQDDDDFQKILTNRWIPLAKANWLSSDGINADILDYGFLTGLLGSPFVRRKIRNYSRLTGKFRLRVAVNSSPALYGCLVVGAVPLECPLRTYGASINAYQRIINAYNIFQLRHAVISPSTSQQVEITLPWINRFTYQNITDNLLDVLDYEQWQILFKVIAPLRNVMDTAATPSLEIKLYGKFDEINLSIPIPDYIPEEELEAQSKVQKVGGFVDDLQRSKIVSKTANKISEVANSVANVPIIGDTAKLIAGTSAAISKIASKMGFSKPATEYKFHRTRLGTNGLLATVDNVDYTVPLSLLTLNEVDSANSRYNENEMDVLSHEVFFRKLTMVFTTTVNVTNGEGHELCKIAVNPMRCQTSGGSITTTPVGLTSSFYTHWSGPLTYQIRMYASALHRFRYRIEYIPHDIGVIPSGSDYTDMTYSAFVDMAQNNSIEFTVGWANDKYCLKTGNFGTTTSAFDPETCNGYFRVVVLNPLKSNNPNAAQNPFVYMQVFMYATDSLKLYNYGKVAEVNTVIDNELAIQSLITKIAGPVEGTADKLMHTFVNSASHDVSNIVTGEVVDSIRPLLKKPQYLGEFVYDTGDIATQTITDGNKTFYSFRSLFVGPIMRKNAAGVRMNISSSNQTLYVGYEPLAIFPFCFLGWAGHLKYKWLINPSRANRSGDTRENIKLVRPILMYQGAELPININFNKSSITLQNVRYLSFFDPYNSGFRTPFTYPKLIESGLPDLSGALEVSVPFYRHYRYEHTNVIPANNDLSNAAVVETWPCLLIGGAFRLDAPSASLPDSSSSFGSLFYSAGEDFSLGIFVVTPIMTFGYTSF